MAKNPEGFEARVYVKGERVRVANSPSEVVALEFDGYKLQEAAPADEPEQQKPETPVTPTPAAVAAVADKKKDGNA